MSVAHGEHLELQHEEHEAGSGRSMAWWGMILFIGSEALIFANFIAMYLYLEIRNWNTAHWQLRIRSEEHTSELQSHLNLVCRLLLEKKKHKLYTNCLL